MKKLVDNTIISSNIDLFNDSNGLKKMHAKLRRLLRPCTLSTVGALFFLFMVVVHNQKQQIPNSRVTDVLNYRKLYSNFEKELFFRLPAHRVPVTNAETVVTPKDINFSKPSPKISSKTRDKEREQFTKIKVHKHSDDDYERYFRPTKRINPFKYDFVINGSAICNNTRPFLIILILSIPKNREVRNAIRKTWGSLAKGGIWPKQSIDVNVKLAFLLGMSEPKNLTLTELINEESTQHGDLIEGNFTDSYYNLTLKVLLGLKWVTLFCNDATFVVKADEDTFVNLPKLIKVLQQKPVGPRGKIFGCFHWRHPVLRSGKWKLDPSLYPFSRYPNYVSGGSYFISINLVSRLFKASEYFPYIFVEDAFITGILKKAVNTTIATLPGVTFLGDVPATPITDKNIYGKILVLKGSQLCKIDF
ncbi:hypothetical protein KUTeg_003506 [Tegillarca granosa]|uniref:Hexosyltransferase n=1 Tax=Tegillarca granosa TaxID=220873 RepID=A0ABQ9FQ76_TEGGR|nr:hypothetical protein KUTeg_003506 [Tegillarca granosa]